MKRERSKTHAAQSQPRPSRRIHDEAHDPYELRGKLSDPSFCSKCRALYLAGRWLWKEPPVGAAETLCPACRRTADGYPAGVLTISGSFARAHREELESLLRHVEEREKLEHPLHRIMTIEAADDALQISTTQANLARAMGRALQHAYQGELTQSPSTEPPLRVHWQRD